MRGRLFSLLQVRRSYTGLVVILWLTLLAGSASAQPVTAAPSRMRDFTREAHLMGSHFTFTAVSADDTLAWRAIRAGIGEARRIDRLFSYWDSTSQITRVNRLAGQRPVAVDQEVYDLIQRTLRISELSGGAFDIPSPVATRFTPSTRRPTPPSPTRPW